VLVCSSKVKNLIFFNKLLFAESKIASEAVSSSLRTSATSSKNKV
jgi:hypothetical protein